MTPYDAMAGDAWARLMRAGDEPAHPMRLMVMATSGERGAVDARLMVLRGADRRSARLWFYTDVRSVKVTQLAERADVCLVGWDRTASVQLRVRGRATVEATGETVERHWKQTSMRALYASPVAPGVPLHHLDPRYGSLREVFDAGGEAWARRNFGVIEVGVTSIEYLQVDAEEQRRGLLRADTGWACEPLAP